MAHPFMYIVPGIIALGGAIIGFIIYNQHQQLYNNHRPRPHNNSRSRRPDRSSSYFDEGNNCSICLEDITESSKKYLACGHCFHSVCIQKWLIINSACPNCKAPL